MEEDEEALKKELKNAFEFYDKVITIADSVRKYVQSTESPILWKYPGQTLF